MILVCAPGALSCQWREFLAYLVSHGAASMLFVSIAGWLVLFVFMIVIRVE